jgi:PTS system mannose-specific IIA component
MTSHVVGVVIVTHGGHGGEMLREAVSLVGDLPMARAVTVGSNDSREAAVAKIQAASQAVDSGGGTLFLVDLHGSTPANICVRLIEDTGNEVLCGLNMAMLLKLATCDRTHGPHELAELLATTGRRSIRLGDEITGQVHVPK